MLSPRIILANGCSFCYGSELFENPESRLCFDNDARRKAAWPGQLGELLGCGKSINLGYPGGSNDRVVRTTLNWLAHNLSAIKLSNSQLFVVIGWTSPLRREFFIDGDWRQIIPYHDYVDMPTSIFNRMYRELAWSDEESATRFAIQLLSLQSFLSSHAIPYLFFDALQSFREIDENGGGVLHPFVPYIDFTRYFGTSPGAEETQSALPGPKLPGGHPDAAGHAAWAARLAAHLHCLLGDEIAAPLEIGCVAEGLGSIEILDRRIGLAKRPILKSQTNTTPSIGAETLSQQKTLARRIADAFRRHPFTYE